MPVSCSSCGAEAQEGARFCHICGAELFRRCPTCGAEQPATAAFCSSCGAALQRGVRRAEPGDEQEERRVVTVLFADLAGSTALGERLDPEDVRALQGELFALVNAEVERHGGVSEKFVGDAILAVFGIPQTHEDDAERAVRAALAVQDAFPSFAGAIADRHGADIGLRIGVNTGDVVSARDAAARGELMVSGDAVNVAARLQQLADPGAVLVGERTRRATRRVVTFEDAGELQAKGKELPVRAWRALAAGGDQRARGGAQSSRLIGRDDELEMLRLTAARVGRERAPQLVTIFGNAGVGKSRLVEEFTAGLEPARVVTGRCVPYGDGLTYLPLAQVASSLAQILDDDRSDMALAKLRTAVESSLPAEQAGPVLEALAWTMGLSLPGESAGIGGAGDVQSALHDAWTRYLTSLGREQLLVVVIDDIHWASAPLLDALEHLVDALEDTEVLVICPSRPELVETRPTWGTGRLNVSSLSLAPLGTADAAHLLESLLGGALTDEIARAILDPADGNPFFVEEMLAMLVEQGAIEERNGHWSAAGGIDDLKVPDSIHGVIAARIDLLDAREREALRRCSVMGRVFWPSAVGADDELIAGLSRRAIVSEQRHSSLSGRREFAYKHALTHDVAYTTLPRTERRELHRRVAEWMADVMPDRHAETTELIAYHYEQALEYGERDEELQRRAFEALIGAGAAAERRGGYVSAEALLGRALALAPATGLERARALLMAARVDIHMARYDRAIERLDETIETAGAVGDQALRADALGVKARATWLYGRWKDSLDSALASVAVLEGLPESEELARSLARLSQIEMLRSLPTAEATATRAIDVARRTGDPFAEVNASINRFTARTESGALPPNADVAAVVDQALAAGAHDEAVRAVVNHVWSAASLGSLDGAEQFVGEIIDRVTVGLTAQAYEQYLRLSLAMLVYIPAGRWADADGAITPNEPFTATNRLVWLAVVTGQALRTGKLDVADRYLPTFRETALATEEPQRIVPMAAVAMPRAVVGGDAAGVRELAEQIASWVGKARNWPLGLIPIARSLAAIEDHDALDLVTRDLAAPPDGVPGTMLKVTHGLRRRLAGELGPALQLLREAEREAAAWGRRYDAACIALEVATTLEQSGDRAGAGEARERAQAVLAPLGCVNPY